MLIVGYEYGYILNIIQMILYLFILSIPCKADLNQLQYQINYHQQFNFIYTHQRHQNPTSLPLHQPPPSYNHTRQHISQTTSLAQFTSACHIPQNPSSFHLITTSKTTYIALNNPHHNNFLIYTHECEKLKIISNTQIIQIACDRGICSKDTIYFVASDGRLFSCDQNQNLHKCQTLTKIQQKVKGAVIRTTENNQQIIIAYEGGVKVYDKRGHIIYDIPFQLHGKIIQMKDHHPHPIILSDKGWIHYFDYINYVIRPSKCPYVRQLKSIFVENPYQTMFYGFSDFTIFIFQFRSIDKSCQIVNTHTQLQRFSLDSIQANKGYIYADNKIIDPRVNSVSYFIECGERPKFMFEGRKSSKNNLMMVSCCDEAGSCQIRVSKQIYSNSGKYPFIFTIFIMMFFFLFVVCFVRSMRRSNLRLEETDGKVLMK